MTRPHHLLPTILPVLCFAVVIACARPAAAYDFAPLKPLDTAQVDPTVVGDLYGAYEIRDASGRKRCRIVLRKEPAIGGNGIEVGRDCAKHFPIMSDIAGWRVLEGWAIDLIDPLRKTRVRFETPDARYVAFGAPADIAGMDELRKLPDRPKGSTR